MPAWAQTGGLGDVASDQGTPELPTLVGVLVECHGLQLAPVHRLAPGPGHRPNKARLQDNPAPPDIDAAGSPGCLRQRNELCRVAGLDGRSTKCLKAVTVAQSSCRPKRSTPECPGGSDEQAPTLVVEIKLYIDPEIQCALLSVRYVYEWAGRDSNPRRLLAAWVTTRCSCRCATGPHVVLPSRAGGARTPNLRFWRPLLYQIALPPYVVVVKRRRDGLFGARLHGTSVLLPRSRRIWRRGEANPLQYGQTVHGRSGSATVITGAC